MSRWDTPISVWAKKTGAIPNEQSDSIHLEVGSLLEDDVAELFTRRTEKKLARVNQTVFHKQYPFLAANLDYRIVGEDAGLECKTATAWKSKEWEGDEIPREYIFQCVHQLAVTGKKRWYLAVLIGNQDFKWICIERDEKLIGDVVAREVKFWNDFVLPNVMPSIVSKYDGDTLDKLFPSAIPKKEIQLGDEANILIENLQAYQADMKSLDDFIEKAKNELKVLLGDADQGVTNLYRVRWSNSTSSRLDADGIEQKHPEIYAEFYKTKSIRRFTYGKLKQEN